MTKKHFDKELVQTVRNEVEAALQTIAEKYGLKASTLGNIGYSPQTMTTAKLTFAIASSQEDVSSVNLIDLVGKRFKHGSRTFTIMGVEGEKLLARTNRGARYLIKKEHLAEMIQL